MFISIGGHCAVKYQKDKHIGKRETLFFDWLLTDMNSVNIILSYYKNIDDLLFFENIIQDPKKKTYGVSNSRMLIKSLSKCISIHDIKVKYNRKDIENFIEKYKRRFQRIIDFIRGNEQIFFVRLGNVTIDEKNHFIELIKQINPECHFTMISLSESESIAPLNPDNLSTSNYLSLNCLDYKISKKKEKDWTRSYFDWKKIFIDIQKS